MTKKSSSKSPKSSGAKKSTAATLKKVAKKTVSTKSQTTQRVVADISVRSILKILFIAGLLWFVFEIRTILVSLFVAFILTAAIQPFVDKLEDKKIPRALSILGIFTIIIGFLILLVALIIPPIADQVIELAQVVPQYYDLAITEFQLIREAVPESAQEQLQSALLSIGDSLQSGASSTFGAISTVFGGFITFITILVLTFYMTIERNTAQKLTRSLFPSRYHAYITKIVQRIETKMGAWVRGQLTLSLIIGLMIFIGLASIGVEYALVLALLAGVMELIPIVGVIIAIIPALFLALTQSPPLAIGVLILFIVVQQLENNLIVPKVMQKAVGLNPMVILVAILIGAQLAGFLGVLLAVPVTTTLVVLWRELRARV